jgi:hypothetical protein
MATRPSGWTCCAEQRIDAQRQHLDRCLDLIKFKIGVYEDILAATTGT